MIYVFLDVEATCGVPNEIREIIRISVVVWCAERKIVLVVFDEYLKPVNGTVNKLCTEITGITQQFLNEFGIEFGRAIKKLNMLLEYYGVFRNGDFRFVTVSDWDIGEIFPQQARISGCRLSKHYRKLKKRIDIQAEFMRMYGIKNAVSLPNMLKYFGKEFSGKRHNSVDDCFNTLELFLSMYCEY